VWTLEERQKLIESLLKKYPVPAILIAERDGKSGTYEIIDGLQRLHSIVSFIENASLWATGIILMSVNFQQLRPQLQKVNSRGQSVAGHQRKRGLNDLGLFARVVRDAECD